MSAAVGPKVACVRNRNASSRVTGGAVSTPSIEFAENEMPDRVFVAPVCGFMGAAAADASAALPPPPQPASSAARQTSVQAFQPALCM
jgi:hypothetical protein